MTGTLIALPEKNMSLINYSCTLLVVFLLSTAIPTLAAIPQYDLVFDLDWTLFDPVSEKLDDSTIQVGAEYYRLADGAAEVISLLHQQGHRISIFSGGKSPRNLALAQFLQKKIHRLPHSHSFSFFKILSYTDLTARPGATEDMKFVQRFMKDLLKISSNLSHVILAEDNAGFSVKGQEKNLYWLGPTYNYSSDFKGPSTALYEAPSWSEWFHNRNRIIQFYTLFQKALRNQSLSENLLDKMQNLQKAALCSRVF